MESNNQVNTPATNTVWKPVGFGIGDVVLFAADRQVFAVSSASVSTKGPKKTRLCAVVASSPDNNLPMVAPFCGAVEDVKTRKRVMNKEVWNPVSFIDKDTRAPISLVPIPEDGYADKRDAITFTCVSAQLTPGALKPCYMWVGDAGEKAELALITMTKEHLKMDDVDQQLPKVQKYWKEGRDDDILVAPKSSGKP
ncbi:hypothetical protein DFH29DRAFT_1015628 [Suillus ampliporus]|nr:hypothetical protein DFH29DRAFT_1015628 [Suillus ampliporus]